ncbi:MAG: hypothetical protein FWG65_12780 [Turicibacter sp.]|nr:hypothetical protein [Turicibacter sp.]
MDYENYTQSTYEVYSGIVSATNSELILFFVIAAILSPVVIGLILRHSNKVKKLENDRAEKIEDRISDRAKLDREHEIEREKVAKEWQKLIIKVVEGNTEAVTSLKICQDGIKKAFDGLATRLHNRMDTINDSTKDLAAKYERLDVKMDTVIAEVKNAIRN